MQREYANFADTVLSALWALRGVKFFDTSACGVKLIDVSFCAMDNMLHTTRDVIKALGGASKVSRRLTSDGHDRIGRTAVQNWEAEDQFPPKTKDALKQMLSEIGLDASDHLWPMLKVLPDPEEELPSRPFGAVEASKPHLAHEAM